MGFKMTDILPPAGWPNVRQLETNEFATGGANGNMNEQAKSLAARTELLKNYTPLPYESGKSYKLNERVQLATGDIVRSTIPSNVNNPNVDMTGWEVPSLKTADNLSDVPNKATARSNLSVYSQAQVDNAIANATPTIPDATETTAGKAKIATTAIAQAGTNDTDFLTALKLKNSVFGMGQAWQDVTSSRVSGTTYTNTTGKPIQVNATSSFAGDGESNVSVSVGGLVVGQNVSRSANSTKRAFVSAVIPSGQTYLISWSGTISIMELR